jgi:hypothetical protein
MQNMERQIQSGVHSMEAMDVHMAMVLVNPSKTSLPSPPDVTPSTAKWLTSVIAAYRLMDMLYALQSPSASTTNPRYAKWGHSGLLLSDKVSVATTLCLQIKRCEI